MVAAAVRPQVTAVVGREGGSWGWVLRGTLCC